MYVWVEPLIIFLHARSWQTEIPFSVNKTRVDGIEVELGIIALLLMQSVPCIVPAVIQGILGVSLHWDDRLTKKSRELVLEDRAGDVKVA